MAAVQPPPVQVVRRKRHAKQQTPQQSIDAFWAKFAADEKTSGKPTTIIPQSHHSVKIVKHGKSACSTGKSTQASYEEAVSTCRAKIEQIVKECRRLNQKYRDSHFDIELDLKFGVRDCLESLSNRSGKDATNPGYDHSPRSAKRAVDIFDKPQFFIDGPSADDVRQGRDGDCWLMAALCTLSNVEGLGLVERLCVAHDQEVGVYGFVFHRDGEWVSEIIDDYLYVTKADYNERIKSRILLDELEKAGAEEAYRKIYQSNSNALYFAASENLQETWLPLLEKAFAKAHGDYAALEGGFTGEAIEDLTGGVTTEIFTTDILNKDDYWRDMLKVNRIFLFSCSTGIYGIRSETKEGIIDRHAYSIQNAVEIDGKRLLRLKNPWGMGEWKGAWSDGSIEWTAEWLEKLGHKFGDDGDFWIEYGDFLRKFQVFERTRLFTEAWQMANVWTKVSISPCVVDYQNTYFSLKLLRPSKTVIVLAQLDDRYFRGLQGEYRLDLAFRIHQAGHTEYLVRTSSRSYPRMNRSVNLELDLEPGEYDVRIKVTARRVSGLVGPEDVVRRNANTRRNKLTRIGLAYDLAHSKGLSAQNDGVHHSDKIQRRGHREGDKQYEKKTHDGRKKPPQSKSGKKLERAGGDQTMSRTNTTEQLEQSEADGSDTTGSVSRLSENQDSIVDKLDSASSNGDSPSDSDSSTVKYRRRSRAKPSQYRHESSRSRSQHRRPRGRSRSSSSGLELDPWNASGVIGLRVYYMPRDESKEINEELIQLKVVLPKTNGHSKRIGEVGDNPADNKIKDGEGEEREITQGLDVDDAEKDQTLNAAIEEKKTKSVAENTEKSIVRTDE